MKFRAAGKKAEILIYELVGEWLGGISAKRFADELKALGRIELINLRFNSIGGDVADGLAIFNLLEAHPARIEADIDGYCCSIATIIAMSADHVRMAGNAMFMVHEPSGGVFGTAAELRKRADYMDQVRENMVDTYVKHTGESPAKIAELMAGETWMKATEAVQLGFVDEITSELEMAAMAPSGKEHFATFTKAPPIKTELQANEFRARLAANAGRVQKICGASPQ